MPNSQADEILLALRVQVCQLEPGDELSLPEVELAKRFGVSRTPIRQVLQTLQRQRLVEIRAGAGARVPPLDAKDRAFLFLLYQDLEVIAAKHAIGVPVPRETMAQLRAIHEVAQTIKQPKVDDYVELGVRLHRAIMTCVENDILRDSISTTYWRLLRWRVKEVRDDLNFQWDTFRRNVRNLLLAGESNDSSHLLRHAAGIAGDMAYPLYKT